MNAAGVKVINSATGNGDQFYPAVFEAIAQAQQKIILETFILFEDEVGKNSMPLC